MTCSCAYPSVCITVKPSVWPSVCLSLPPSACLYLCKLIRPHACLPVCVFVFLTIQYLPLPLYQSIYIPDYSYMLSSFDCILCINTLPVRSIHRYTGAGKSTSYFLIFRYPARKKLPPLDRERKKDGYHLYYAKRYR